MPDTRNGAALLEVAREFRPRILAERDDIETSRRLPEHVSRDLARAGFFRIFLPAAYGGLDLTPMEGAEIFEQLTLQSPGACSTATRIGLSPNSRPKPHERCTPTPMS